MEISVIRGLYLMVLNSNFFLIICESVAIYYYTDTCPNISGLRGHSLVNFNKNINKIRKVGVVVGTLYF